LGAIERNLNNQKNQFDKFLKTSRCPRDGYRVLELERPEVICEKCSTKYVAASDGVKSKAARRKLKLVERFDAWYW
jgi:hypothetical protein